MSVVVFDGKILACDLMANDGHCGWPVEKIVLSRDLYRVGVGTEQDIRNLHQWVERDMKTQSFPVIYNESALILVSKDFGCTRWTSKGLSDHGFYTVAFGTGRDFAYGALAHGADAIEAVEATNKYSVTCGLGVAAYDVMTGTRLR